MISRSVQSFIVASFFLASLVIALCTGNALAGNITYDNNSFTGTSTNLTILGQTLLPYTDPDGRVVSIVSGPVAFRTVNFGGVVIVHHDYDPPRCRWIFKFRQRHDRFWVRNGFSFA